ncbi:hypothetical protein [Actinomadura bangladeshensis]|uniref:hypothetical protein n=1 Tax=Actinomadura bangladeshensis TaxID=453573 RepID=UPI0014050C21|nr:hypothetical protein [Actinomadura bangladeshensis]
MDGYVHFIWSLGERCSRLVLSERAVPAGKAAEVEGRLRSMGDRRPGGGPG